MSENDSAEKSFEPTQRKLDDARKKGELAKSADLSAAAAFFGLFVILALGGTWISASLGSSLMLFISNPDHLADPGLEGIMPAIDGLLPQLAAPILALFAVPALAAVSSLAAQRAIVIAPKKLEPKLSRISLVSNAKNKFGRSGLFEFAKSAVKLAIYSAGLGLYLNSHWQGILSTLVLPPRQIVLELARLSTGFILLSAMITLVIGAVDFLWQRSEHLRKNRMSHKEMRDEMKESEGDPHFKSARRSRAQEIANNKMLADVPSADVVIVNPTHYAVALKWSRQAGSAPVVVAKGQDEIAARIRGLAQESGVPIHSDPPTARSLHSSVQIGQEIPVRLYQAVAAAIRFAEQMRERRRRGWLT